MGIVAIPVAMFSPPAAATYAGAVASDNPVGYWRMGDTSGTTMADSASGSHAGTYSGSPLIAAGGLVVGDTNAAVRFNGSSQYATVPYFSGMNVGGSMTVEAVVEVVSYASSVNIVARRGNGSATNYSTQCWALRMDGSAPGPFHFQALWFYGASGLVNIVGTTPIVLGARYHVVMVCDATSARLYVNGALDATGSNAAVNWNQVSSDLHVAGGFGASASITELFPGKIDEVAIYSGALSASRIAAHATALGSGDAYFGQVKLLCHGEGPTGAGAVIIDDSLAGRAITKGGSGTLGSTAKFGSTALYIPSSGSYLSAPNSSDWNFSDADFTVEGFFNFTGTTGTYQGMCVHDEIGGTRGWLLYRNDASGSYTISFGIWDTSGTQVNYACDSGFSPTAGVWYHVAASRVGSNLRIFIDGVLKTTTSVGTAVCANPSQPLVIGALCNTSGPAANSYMNGYIDELRITKGVGRYTATFTVPASSYPNAGDVFSPLTLANLYAWYDPSDSAAVTLSGSNVTQLTDKSGNSRHATQATSGNQFLKSSAALNGLDAIVDNASHTSYMGFSSLSSNTALSLVAVTKPTTDHASPNIIGPSAGGAGGFGWGALGSLKNAVYEVSPTKSLAPSGVTTALTRQSSLLMTWDPAVSTGLLEGYRNGSKLTSSVSGTSPSGLVFDQIGYQNASTYSYTGLLGEIIMLSRALTTTEIDQITLYLRSRWNT